MYKPTPWRSAFVASLSTMRETNAALCTISPSPSSVGTPHVRTVVMRYLLGSIEPHPQNPAPLNPRGVYESDMPVFTTDVRSEKVAHLFSGGDDGGRDTAITGGGGPVEMVFWASEKSVQWRLAGRAYILGPDADDDTPSARHVRSVLWHRMRAIRGPKGEGEDWSWAREVTAMFGNQSPQTRGWFRQPPPGVSVDEPLPDKRLGFGQRVDDLDDELARRHFRIVVVVPDEVDQADLSDPERPRRWRHTFGGESWATVELWP